MKKKKNLVIAISVLSCCWLFSVKAAEALLKEEINNIRVYEKASGAVVNITSRVVRYDMFFNAVPREGTGSGVLIDPEGYIVTNNHVTMESKNIEVTLADGRILPAKLVGSAPSMDLALLKIESEGERFDSLTFGDSEKLEVGDKVLAIGNPFGLERTLTVGVVSSLGRSLRISKDQVAEDMIQTDASINPGNSGGPLLDSDGEIIGINTAILSPTGTNAGVGFAIPSHKVKEILPALKGGGTGLFSGKYRLLLALFLVYLAWRLLRTKKRA